MDVVNAEQVCVFRILQFYRSSLTFRIRKARIAEEAGACAVMALERVPADIRSEGNAHLFYCWTSHQ
jgi:hypothetical protein